MGIKGLGGVKGRRSSFCCSEGGGVLSSSLWLPEAEGGDIRKGAPSPAQYHRARLEGATESAALPLNCESERSVSTRPRAARISARERRRNDSVATCRRYLTEHYNAAENGQLYRFLHKGRNLNDVPLGRRDAGASRRSAGKIKGPKSDVRSGTSCAF